MEGRKEARKVGEGGGEVVWELRGMIRAAIWGGAAPPPLWDLYKDSYCFLGFLIVESKGKDGGKEGRKVLKEGGARGGKRETDRKRAKVGRQM